nr:peroxidase N1-like [Quercus suber]
MYVLAYRWIVIALAPSGKFENVSLTHVILRPPYFNAVAGGATLSKLSQTSSHLKTVGVALTNGPNWQVPTGRKDGRVSLASDTKDLPGFIESIEAQKKKFSAKGLNAQDLVSLVGCHTIGTLTCQFFQYGLHNFTTIGNGADPTINPSFLPQLQALCPQNGVATRRVGLDTGSQNRFDESFFSNLRNGRGALQSDQKLWANASARSFVQSLLGSNAVAGATL